MPTHLNRAVVKNDVLRSYLNTHQNVGTAVMRRVTRMLDRAEGPIVPLLEHFQADVEAEQAWLVNLSNTMQLSSTVAMKLSAVTANKIHQLMRTRRQTAKFGRSPLIDVETLSGSVTSKLGLWRTLRDLSDVLPVDRDRLALFVDNAERQLADLATVHQFVLRDVIVA